jgi:hypothetical protein
VIPARNLSRNPVANVRGILNKGREDEVVLPQTRVAATVEDVEVWKEHGGLDMLGPMLIRWIGQKVRLCILRRPHSLPRPGDCATINQAWCQCQSTGTRRFDVFASSVVLEEY